MRPVHLPNIKWPNTTGLITLAFERHQLCVSVFGTRWDGIQTVAGQTFATTRLDGAQRQQASGFHGVHWRF